MVLDGRKVFGTDRTPQYNNPSGNQRSLSILQLVGLFYVWVSQRKDIADGLLRRLRQFLWSLFVTLAKAKQPNQIQAWDV